MELNQIVTLLDNTSLTREVIDLKNYDNFAISYSNYTNETLTATVNNTDYEGLIKVCLVPIGQSVKVYINNIARFNLNKYDLESVSSFSIS